MTYSISGPTRSNPANVSLSQKSGNARVADPVEDFKASQPPSPERGRPVPANCNDEEFAAKLLAKEQQIVALAEGVAKRDVVLKGNAVVADKAPVAGGAKPPSPPAPAPAAGAIAEKQAVAQLAERNAEIAALFAAQVAKPMKTAPRVTMSTEAADVPVDSPTYWVDTSANKKEETNTKILVNHGPKPKSDSTTGFKWVGYCVEGCVCAACVAKRKEPSKTEMHNSKRVSKKPPN